MSDSKLKVAMLGSRGIPARYGGSETAIEEIGQRLAEEGHRVVVYCRRHNSQTDEREYRGMERVVLPSVNRKNWDTPSHTFLSLLDLLLKRRDVDILHFHGVGNSIFLPFLKLTRWKIVVTVDGPDWERPKWGWFAKKVLKLSARMTARLADCTITDNLVSQRLFRELFSLSAEYIPYGAYVTEEKETDELEKYGLKPRQYLLYVGRLIPDKGCHTLVKAFEKVRTDKKLVLVGGNPYFSEYIRQLKSTPDARIQFPGYVYGRPYRQLCGNAYAYCHPLIVDGTSPQLLQAMAFGNCVIASELPEVSDVVGDAALRFPSGDVNKLAEHIQFLVDNPEVVALHRKKAVERVGSLFNWPDVTAAHKRIYQKVVSPETKTVESDREIEPQALGQKQESSR
jgi:glycosyltransferase involved in cell wall biosynthesis